MREKPILFSTPMVQAILDGRKSMTRRVCRLNTNNFDWDKNDKNYGPFLQDKYGDSINVKEFCPYQPGDHLWVRESLVKIDWADGIPGIAYKADNEPVWDMTRPCEWVWKKNFLSSRFMPKNIARIWLEVTDVRAERLQSITAQQAKDEGIGDLFLEDCAYDDKFKNIPWNQEDGIAVHQFARLWDSINAKRGYGWDANPWVWVISFRRIRP